MKSVDLLSIGLLLVISRNADGWTVLHLKFASSQIVDPEARVSVHNMASELAFVEAL